jgi:hypothetical protein
VIAANEVARRRSSLNAGMISETFTGGK